jgi:hypothetical protein
LCSEHFLSCRDSKLHFDSRVCGRVTTLSPFLGYRLIYMHNIKVQPFVRYDMPEKYDLARK